MSGRICRGDLFYADLDPVVGSEQGGVRPVLVVQNDEGNRAGPTVIAAAVTSHINTKAKIPTHCVIRNCGRLKEDSVVLMEQIRTIDKSRLQKYIGRLEDKDMERADRCLMISLGLGRI